LGGHRNSLPGGAGQGGKGAVTDFGFRISNFEFATPPASPSAAPWQVQPVLHAGKGAIADFGFRICHTPARQPGRLPHKHCQQTSELAAFTGRAVSNNIGNSEACCEPTPRAQSLLEGALTGNNAVNIGMHNPEERARGGPRYAKHLTKALWCGMPPPGVNAARGGGAICLIV
jgi:hypothetical protein